MVFLFVFETEVTKNPTWLEKKRGKSTYGFVIIWNIENNAIVPHSPGSIEFMRYILYGICMAGRANQNKHSCIENRPGPYSFLKQIKQKGVRTLKKIERNKKKHRGK